MTGTTVRRQALTLAEIEILERSARGNELILLRLLYETGASLSEALALRWKDVRRERMCIGKRTLPISSRLRAILAQTPPSSAYILSTRESETMTPRRAEQLLGRLGARSLGARITPHQLRHTRIVHDFLNRMPLTAIERKLGLRSVQQHIYAHFQSQEGLR